MCDKLLLYLPVLLKYIFPVLKRLTQEAWNCGSRPPESNKFEMGTARINPHAGSDPDQAGSTPHSRGYSSVNPTFSDTCQCATLPSTTWLRVSVTVNHWILRTVSCALVLGVRRQLS